MQNWILMYITFLKPAKLFFKDIHTRIWKLWDAKHVTNEDTHFTDNLSIVCKHWTHTHTRVYIIITHTEQNWFKKRHVFYLLNSCFDCSLFLVNLLKKWKDWKLPLLEQKFTVHVKAADDLIKDVRCKFKLNFISKDDKH